MPADTHDVEDDDVIALLLQQALGVLIVRGSVNFAAIELFHDHLANVALVVDHQNPLALQLAHRQSPVEMTQTSIPGAMIATSNQRNKTGQNTPYGPKSRISGPNGFPGAGSSSHISIRREALSN